MVLGVDVLAPHCGACAAEDMIRAHMWLNLSAAQDNEAAREARNIVEKQMTPAQIAEAQKLEQQ
jgi:uncharacterized protein